MAEKKTTIKKSAEKDLQAKLAEMRHDHSEALRSHKAGELANPQVLKTTRREIARTLTAINAEKREKEQTNA